MYRLVIVDDERDVRRRLVGMVERSSAPFELIAEYENGIDAYEGILSDNPDLIITDIKIPYIDGIELAKKIREVQPLAKIIVITGFDEFDYAKEAANLGVIGFISKPIKQQDMDGILKKAEELLNSEFLTEANLSQLQSFYESSLPIVRESTLFRLSNMSSVSPALEKRLAHDGIDLQYRYFAMVIFDFDEVQPEGDAEHYELAFSSVRNSLEKELAAFCGFDLFTRYEKLCALLKSNEPLDVAGIERLLERIILRVGRYSDMPLSGGISTVHDERNFYKMLGEAMRALAYRGVMGGRKIFLFGNAATGEAPGLVIDDNSIKELGYMLRFQSAERCVQGLHNIKEAMENSEAHYSYYYVLTSVLNVLVKACDDLKSLYDNYAGHDEMYRRLFDIKTADEVFAYFEELAGVIRAVNDSVIVDSVERNLQKVTTYIDNHYCDADMDFEKVAGEVNFSVSYISALLKKNLNTTFVKYLTSLRMERAQEMLRDSSLKIIDIAERLGYADPYYFSHCFKKYTGMSPKEYRSHE